MENNLVIPFFVQLLQEVPEMECGPQKTGTATGSDHERGDNDRD